MKNKATKTRLSLTFLANWIHRCWITQYRASLTRKFKTGMSLYHKTCQTIRLWWWCVSNLCCQDRQWQLKEWGLVWIINFDPRKITGMTTIADRVCASGKPRVTWVDQVSKTLITTLVKCKLCTIAKRTNWVHSIGRMREHRVSLVPGIETQMLQAFNKRVWMKFHNHHSRTWHWKRQKYRSLSRKIG